jgi:hypothetical protein
VDARAGLNTEDRKLYHYTISSYYCELSEITVTLGRIAWLQTTDDNLKTESKHFWKYTTFKGNDQSIKLKLKATLLHSRILSKKKFQATFVLFLAYPF